MSVLKPKPPKETEIQACILESVKMLPGVRLWRTNTSAFFIPNKSGGYRAVRSNFPGCSDILGWKTEDGVARFVAIEVKRTKHDKPTEEQAAFLRAVEAAGGIAGVARSAADALAILGFKEATCRAKTSSPL